jgi:hypothetical protein
LPSVIKQVRTIQAQYVGKRRERHVVDGDWKMGISAYPLEYVGHNIFGVLCKKAQLSFFDPFQYRYVSSTDVFFGGISLFDIGYYYGYPAAIVSTWTGEQEGIVILEASEFVHVLTNPEGALFTVTYRMTDAPCL